jgi:hypothetical protein
MIEFGGVVYYLDLTAFEKALKITGEQTNDKIVVKEVIEHKDNTGTIIKTEIKETTNERGREIDATKYEVIRLMLEVLMEFNEETDETLGSERALDKAPLSHKLAFNTLYNYGILKEQE